MTTGRSTSPSTLARWVARPTVAAAVLLLVYMGLSFANDERGYLGTDTGGKVATLRAMEERGSLDPDVSYWAEKWDEHGRVHPLYYTAHKGERWVNVTTLPALYAAYPLWRAGGYRAALLVPMLGAVAAALAARSLARRVGAGDGTLAFWVVGLASPLTIYALDFWEHSLGVAFVGWAVVLLFDVLRDEGGWGRSAAAGVLVGAAATMRTESLVYGAVLVAVVSVAMVVRARRLTVRPIVVGVAFVAAAAVPLVGNTALEKATVGHALRTERTTATATAALSAEQGGGRSEEALLTSVGMQPLLESRTYVVGAILLGLLLFVGVRARARVLDRGPILLAGLGIIGLYVIRFVDGVGFVPGLIAATPVAAFALVAGWRSPAARLSLATALLALPLVWRFQYTGGAAPQWGGRYILVSGFLLAVVGIGVLLRFAPWARVGAVGLALAVTGFGLAWMSVRSHDVASASMALDRRPEPVLVSRVAHLVREGGGVHDLDRWLTAVTADDERLAVRVVAAAGIRTFGVVELEDLARRRDIPGWHRVGIDRVRLFSGIDLRVTTYTAS